MPLQPAKQWKVRQFGHIRLLTWKRMRCYINIQGLRHFNPQCQDISLNVNNPNKIQEPKLPQFSMSRGIWKINIFLIEHMQSNSLGPAK